MMLLLNKHKCKKSFSQFLILCFLFINHDSVFSQVSYGANAHYSLRKTIPTYTGNAIQIRRACDNATTNIGFTSCGDLDTNAIKTFVVASNPLSAITSTAAAAYSLRKLSCSYNGNAINIRRSCDNATKDIEFTASGDLDTNALKTFVLAANPLSVISATSAAAYSLRKLRCAYVGSVIRVRRSSDDATQDIGFTASGDLDTNALKAFVGASNGFITIWYDQSGNTRNATQATTANQPIIMNAGIIYRQNSQPAIYFSGSLFLTSSLTAVQATTTGNITTANFVMQSNSGIAGTIFSNGEAAANRYNIHAAWSDNVTYFDIGTFGSGGRLNTPLTWTSLSIGTFLRNGAQGNIWKNGSSIISSSSLSTAVTSTLSISIGGSLAYGSYMTGYISEITCFPSVLTTNEKQYLEWSQSQYYGITGPLLPSVLPSGAPSAFVTTWYDQSGNGRNATQATANNQPRIMNSGIIEKQNGKPAVYFSGLSNSLFTNNFSAYSSAACFNGVAKVNSNLTYNTIINKTNNNNFPCPIDFYNSSVLVGNGVSGQYNLFAASQNFNSTKPLGVWTYQANGTVANGVNAFYNSSSIISNQTATYYNDAAGASLYLGSRYDGVTGLNGWLSEVVTFGTIPSNTDRAFLEWTQGQYYNINGIALGTLPSGAPSAYITNWYDQSGIGNHISQTTNSKQPLIVSSGIIVKLGTKPAILSNTASQTNLTSILSANYSGTQLSTNCVIQSDVGTTANLRIASVGNTALTSSDYNSNNYFNINQRSTNQFVIERNSVINPNTVITVGSPMILSARFSGANRQLFNNGTGSGTTADVNAFNFNSLRILQSINPAFEAGESFTGKITEFGMYYSSLSTTRRTLLETNEAAYYNLTISNNKYTPPALNSYNLYVNGIGRESASDSVRGTRNTAGMGISVTTAGTSFLKDNGDYITTGMNCPILAGLSTSNIPGSVVQRWQNDWYLNKIDIGNNNGLLTLFFDFSDYGVSIMPGIPANYVLLFRTSPAGTFSIVPNTTVTVTGDRVNFLIDGSGITTNNYFTIGTLDNTTSPLPIELVKFNCLILPDKNIALKWITATEMNSHYFDIERSSDGLDFNKIGNVQAAGNSYTTTHYLFNDTNPLSKISYYRLKAVDVDGSYKYSDICSVSLDDLGNGISIYPNPTNSSITIDFTNIDAISSQDYEITDITGKKIEVPYALLADKITIDLSNLQSGIYFIEVKTNGVKRLIDKIILQK